MDNKSTQKQVFAAIETERRFQNLDAKQKKQEDALPVAGEMIVLDQLLADARQAYLKAEIYKDTAALDVIRQIAGVAVRCLEIHGVIERVW